MERQILHVDVNNAFLSWTAVDMLKKGNKINKRETSYQGLVSKFENGEDGIYNLVINDKNVLLTPKISITEKDIAEIPALKQLRESIAIMEEMEKKATGKKKFKLKK